MLEAGRIKPDAQQDTQAGQHKADSGKADSTTELDQTTQQKRYPKTLGRDKPAAKPDVELTQKPLLKGKRKDGKAEGHDGRSGKAKPFYPSPGSPWEMVWSSQKAMLDEITQKATLMGDSFARCALKQFE